MFAQFPIYRLLMLLLALFLSACEQTPVFERIKARGELVVATRVSPSTYHNGVNGPEGVEYEMVTRFAEQHGLKVRWVFPASMDAMFRALSSGEVHMIAAGISPSATMARSVTYSLPYQHVKDHIVYRAQNKRPRKLSDLAADSLHVASRSPQEARLIHEKKEHFPKLRWVSENTTGGNLLVELDRGFIGYALVNANDLMLQQKYYRYLKSAFTIGEASPLTWAFAKRADNSLVIAADKFISEYSSNGQLEELLASYYGHSSPLNFVDKRDFWRHVKERLPLLIQWFIQGASEIGIDWELLAAVGYQESHWNPSAVSPTGVRGIMMLTQATSREVKIANRLDPKQSILGGARYLKIIDKKIPKRIQMPDRQWFALAGYNVGFGHLEDARILTQRLGGNPDLWEDVKKYLPLLADAKYYKTTKHGYARGYEPVSYVENIISYYDLLTWYSNQQLERLGKTPLKSVSPDVARAH